MTDVIRNVNSNNQVAGTTSRSNPSTAQTTSDGNASTPSSVASSTQAAINEQVRLTGAAQQIEEITASLASEPAVNREKVDSIKQALADGSFEVNSAVIAERLIDIDDLLS